MALLAATCSKIGSPSEEGGGSNNNNNNTTLTTTNQSLQNTTATANNSTCVITTSAPSVTTINPGTVTPIKIIGHSNHILQGTGDLSQFLASPNFISIPQTVVAAADGNQAGVAATFKTLPSPTGATANVVSMPGVASQFIQQGTNPTAQIVTTAQGQSITYNVIPQVQNITIDGQEAIYIPAPAQAFQIAGNQAILAAPSGQYIRAQNATSANASLPAGTLGQMGNAFQVAQLGNVGTINGQNVAVRSAPVVQTVQIPYNQLQQTIPIQVPISTSNGQTTYQTIHVPIQTIQAAIPNIMTSGGQITAQVIPQLAPAQVQPQGQLQMTTIQPSVAATSCTMTPPSTSTTGTSDSLTLSTHVMTAPSSGQAGTSPQANTTTQLVAASQIGQNQLGQVAWWPAGPISIASLRPTTGNVVQVQNLSGIPIQSIQNLSGLTGTNIQVASSTGQPQIVTLANNAVSTSTASSSHLSPQVQTLSQILTSTPGEQYYYFDLLLFFFQRDVNVSIILRFIYFSHLENCTWARHSALPGCL